MRSHTDINPELQITMAPTPCIVLVDGKPARVWVGVILPGCEPVEIFVRGIGTTDGSAQAILNRHLIPERTPDIRPGPAMM